MGLRTMTRFFFRKIPKDDPVIYDVYRLRYKVYCEEWGFEKPEDHPGKLETDEYDQHSIHLGAFSQEDGNLIGTIRLILDSELGFPIDRHCTFNTDISSLDRSRIAEISRLAVSKEYRKRAVDKLIYNNGEPDPLQGKEARDVQEKRKQEFFIIMGLYICMYMESSQMGLTHWFAVMANGLSILLKRMKIQFTPIGPAVEYHGRRIPYIGAIDDIVSKVAAEQPEAFQSYKSSIVGGQ